MPVFYRGAGVGTWWHRNDARHEGFFAWRPAKEGKVNDVVNHIVRGTVSSPYISLTRSYGVAFSYAVRSGHEKPAKENPSFVYEVHLPESVTDVQLLDPIVEIVSSLPKPLENFTYHHDGEPDCLLGVVSPQKHARQLSKPYRQAPPGGGTPRPPLLTFELEALVRALRDAELLAVGRVPRIYVKERYEVW